MEMTIPKMNWIPMTSMVALHTGIGVVRRMMRSLTSIGPAGVMTRTGRQIHGSTTLGIDGS